MPKLRAPVPLKRRDLCRVQIDPHSARFTPFIRLLNIFTAARLRPSAFTRRIPLLKTALRFQLVDAILLRPRE